MRILSLIIAILCLQACSSGETLPPLPRDGVILAFGDSITYGTGANPGEGYPEVLQGLTGRRVVNGGVPGEVSADGLKRLPQVLEQEKPALMILCHGGNDILQRLDARATADNIRSMVRLAREQGVSVVLVGVPAADLSLKPPPFYADVAKEFHIPCEDRVLSRILGRGSLKSDYIHPNAAGYRLLAETLAKLMVRSGAL